MTRLAILADIHGNLPALEAVLADLASFPIDGVVERALAAGWAVIRENNEFYLLDYDTPRPPASWVDPTQYTMLPWLRRQLVGPLHARIASWSDAPSVYPPDAPPRILHGSARSNSEGIIPAVDETELVLLLDRRIERWHILNPGSVGVPLQGELVVSYLVLDGDSEGWHGTFRRVPIDNRARFAAFADTGVAAKCGVMASWCSMSFAPRVSRYCRSCCGSRRFARPRPSTRRRWPDSARATHSPTPRSSIATYPREVIMVQKQFKKHMHSSKFAGGDLFVVPPALEHPGFFYLATQSDMYHASKTFLNRALRNLAKYCEAKRIVTVALPKIGAGLGKLSWETAVCPLLQKHLGESRTLFSIYEDLKLEYEAETGT